MPKYSILEAVIENAPAFDNLSLLSDKLKKSLIKESEEIVSIIKNWNWNDVHPTRFITHNR